MEHSSEHEHNFVKVFIAVLIALTLFTLFCIYIARTLSTGSGADSNDSIMRAALLERIAPVGAVNTSLEQVESQSAAASTSAGPETPEQLVARACAACHLAGVAGAPKSDDAAEWGKRRELGLEALLASVTNGKGAMPPRAGSDLDDEQLVLAVKYLAGFDTDADDASESDAATTESATTEAAAAPAAAAPTELSAKAKSAADTLCAGCHISGAGGAPKLGDKADWGKRAERGLDAMVQTVVTGKGAMPPRGGSDLTEDELAQAVQYLMSK